jgi:hypothetical protein
LASGKKEIMHPDSIVAGGAKGEAFGHTIEDFGHKLSPK